MAAGSREGSESAAAAMAVFTSSASQVSELTRDLFRQRNIFSAAMSILLQYLVHTEWDPTQISLAKYLLKLLQLPFQSTLLKNVIC